MAATRRVLRTPDPSSRPTVVTSFRLSAAGGKPEPVRDPLLQSPEAAARAHRRLAEERAARSPSRRASPGGSAGGSPRASPRASTADDQLAADLAALLLGAGPPSPRLDTASKRASIISADGGGGRPAARTPASLAHSPLCVPDGELHVDSRAFIGRGGFADVYKGELRGKEVAVKLLRGPGGGRLLLPAEVEACCAAPEHPNVVPILGFRPSPPLIVLPYYPAGSLAEHLSRLGWPRAAALPLLRDAALGAAHLHAHGVVHGDIKPANVLVHLPPGGGEATALLADPALSRGKGGGRTMRYAAPELFRLRSAPSPASDAWAFGMACWAVLSGGVEPYAHCAYERVLMRSYERGERPPRPDRVPDALWDLLARCWAERPAERPALADAAATIAALIDSGAFDGAEFAAPAAVGADEGQLPSPSSSGGEGGDGDGSSVDGGEDGGDASGGR